MNNKIRAILKKKKKSVYGLGKVLGISSQAAEYLVKKKNLQADYDRLKQIADYCEEPIEDLFG